MKDLGSLLRTPFLFQRKLMLGALAALLPWCSLAPLRAAELLREDFESYTVGVAIPTVPAVTSASGVKSSAQLTATAGISAIGSGGKVAWLNDVIAGAGGSGQLELNAGSAPQTTLAVTFDIFNNGTPATSQPINIGLLAWNSAVATAGGSSAKRIAGLTFNQSGTATTQTYSVQGNGTVSSGLTYDRSVRESVALYANDHDSNPINYIGPDAVFRTLNANSFAVFVNGVFVITSALNPAATDNAGTLLAGNSNLGRIGFNTTTTNTGSWLIDNVVISDMPSGITQPAPAITSTLAVGGQLGAGFTYQITATNSPVSFAAAGLPPGLGIDTTTGLITGTPTVSGNFSVTLSATNGGGTGTATLLLTVAAAAPVITSATTAEGREAAAFSYQITASGFPVSFGASGLPGGLSVNPDTGAITGKPAKGTAGTWSVTISATNSGGTGSATLTLKLISEYEALRLKWRDTLVAGGGSLSSVTSKASGYQATMSPAGTMTSASTGYLWSDLPLGVQAGVAADTASGNIVSTYKRLYAMALAWATPGGSLYGDTTLAANVVSGLDWMNLHFFTSTTTLYGNWFDWEVSAAQALANTAVLMQPTLSLSQIRNYIAAIYNFGPDSVNQMDYFWWGALTGANTVSVAQVMAIQGILLGENSATVSRFWHDTTGHPVNPQPNYVVTGASLLDEARGNLSGNNPEDWDGASVFAPVTDGDGFYEDGSYIFHGNVAYNGHYGLVMLEGVVNLAKLLDGSSWTIDDPDFNYVYDWITKGFEPLFYHGAFMDCVRGRSIAQSGETGASVGVEVLAAIKAVSEFVSTPAGTAAEMASFVKSPHPPEGQYHFANMDRVVAHRAGFSFALSMSSTRVNNYEDLFGDSNTKGYFQGDGMGYVYVGGTETQFTGAYWPTVDIYHLPGTTTEQGTVSTPSPTDQDFVGGAEVKGPTGASLYGVAAMSLHPVLETGASTLFGKKSYFMFKDEVVCLGSGITCSSANEVDTTVENRRLGAATTSATLWVNGAPSSRALGASLTLTAPKSCAIEGVGGYYFYNSPANLQTAFLASSGTWTDIHPGDTDTATYSDNYLKLYYRHGVAPVNASYAYAILPGMSPGAVGGYALNPQTTILANTTALHAVKNQVLGVVAANFWSGSGGTADLLGVNKACSAITLETALTLSLGISDPTQNLGGPGGVITVTLNRAATGTLTVDEGVTVVRTTPTIQLTTSVAGANGKTLHASFSLAPKPVVGGNLDLVGVAGTALNYQITATGSPLPTAYVASGLPPGLVLNTTTGVISGTPLAAGVYPVTLGATNANGTGYATLTTTIANVPADVSFTFSAPGAGTWLCPANVTSVQVECWGAGGAGGSAQRVGGSGSVQYGGGGAGGAYARLGSYAVTPGSTYHFAIGAGAENTSATNDTTVAGGDTWFNSVNAPSSVIIAKGGAGGQSAIGATSSTAFGTGGQGSTAGNAGDVIYAGGNGANGAASSAGGGGSGAGSGANGTGATSNLGAVAPSGGGGGGTGPTTGSLSGGGGSAPGGGGAGARDSSGAVIAGGTGGAGRIILTVNQVAVASTPPTIGTPTFTGVTDTAATLGGNVTSDGGATLSGRGIVYAATATNPSPRIGGAGVVNLAASGTTGAFTVNVSGLSPGTAYTFAAYATNANGTSYTAESGFTTLTSIESWRLNHFGISTSSGAAADLADPDGDGLTNAAEYVYGTTPTFADASAILSLTTLGTNHVLNFVAAKAAGVGYDGRSRSYTLETCNALGAAWTPVAGFTGIVGANQNVTASLTAGSSAAFYRLKISLQ